MGFAVGDREIRRVLIVDDNPDYRESLCEQVEDAGLEPVESTHHLGRTQDLVDLAQERADAAFCDHHLKGSGYADFDGAEGVAHLYKEQVPAILCTRFLGTSHLVDIRRYRRWIPSLITPDEAAEPEAFHRAYETCVREMNGDWVTSRKPHRTLVEVESVDRGDTSNSVNLIIPAWRTTEVVEMPLGDFPRAIRSDVLPGTALYARVNTAAEEQGELYFEEWELSR